MPVDIIKSPELLGANLKQLRLIKETTLEEAAGRAGISKGFLSLIESGKRSIKFIDLRNLLAVYDYSLSFFLSRIHDSIEDNKFEPDAVIQNRCHNILITGSRDDGQFNILLYRPLRHSDDTGIYELNVPPNFEITNEHFIVPSEVRGVITNGKMLIDFKNDEFTVKEGEEFCFDGNTPHTYRNFTNQPASAILIISPAKL